MSPEERGRHRMPARLTLVDGRRVSEFFASLWPGRPHAPGADGPGNAWDADVLFDRVIAAGGTVEVRWGHPAAESLRMVVVDPEGRHWPLRPEPA